MKKLFLLIVFLLISVSSFCQTGESTSSFNLDFEIIEDGKLVGWNNFERSNYILALDSTTVKSGEYSVSIEYKDGAPGFKPWAFAIPHNYEGKKITLSGYIKTENVTDGFAGLWMRIDPSVAFDNMGNNGVTGTTNWTKHEITLDMKPDKTEQIVVGGLLVGKGKMWLDDFKISIDGKDIRDLKPYEREILPAEKDNEFEKGSGITEISVDKTNIKNLKTLGLIWGFLKYYHPNIAAGEYNWDYELFRILPEIMNSENEKKRDEALIEWIESLGVLTEGKEPEATSAEVKFGPDLDWIYYSKISGELKTVLLKVKNAKRAKEHFYIGLHPGIGNPDFKNEKAYASMTNPDAGFRLLALYRYWNIIQYYFPYKNLIKGDWKIVLEEFIPRFLDAENETEYTLAVLELIGQVHDTHANIWGGNPVLTKHFGLNYAAVEISFIKNCAVVTGYHDENLGKETGLQPGDKITAINTKPVDEIISERLKYSPASNYPTKLRDIAPNLLRTNDSIIEVEFVRNSKLEMKTLETYTTREINIYGKYQVPDSSFKFINKDIVYIHNGALKNKDLPEIWRKIEDTKGLIIDIRNYPSDFPIYDLSKYLMPQSTPFVKFTNGSINEPGLFTYTKTSNVGGENKDHYKGKVVILINEISQSSAEFHAMAYRVHPNATVIGSTTAGADGNVSQFYLPGGISTMISGIGVYYPDGTETQRIGIIPDVEIQPTIEGVRDGRDELMEQAIDIINGKHKKEL